MRIHRIGYSLVVFWLAFLAVQPGAAVAGVEQQSPEETVKTVTTEMLTALRSQQEAYRGDHGTLHGRCNRRTGNRQT